MGGSGTRRSARRTAIGSPNTDVRGAHAVRHASVCARALMYLRISRGRPGIHFQWDSPGEKSGAMSNGAGPASYRFGHCELLPGQQRLLVEGQTVAVGPRAFDLLVALVERAGELVSKDELLAS